MSKKKYLRKNVHYSAPWKEVPQSKSWFHIDVSLFFCLLLYFLKFLSYEVFCKYLHNGVCHLKKHVILDRTISSIFQCMHLVYIKEEIDMNYSNFLFQLVCVRTDPEVSK